MGDEKNEGPVSNIKEYIVNGRKNGFSDTKIIENLKKTNWPDDVIESAVKEADTVIPAVTEESQEKEQELPKEEKKEETKEEQPKEDKKEGEAKEEAPTEKKPDKKQEEKLGSDLLTKPPQGIFPDKKEGAAQEPVKKKFSFWALIALFLSPIPFVGLGAAMAAIDDIRKNHKSGTILAILSLIINGIIILGIIYILFLIFTLPPENLPGFVNSDFISGILEKLNIQT